MNAVKERMLSRRDFFRASAAVTATAAVGGVVAAPPALAGGHGSVVDMTQPFPPDFPTFFGTPSYSIEQAFNFAESGFNLFNPTYPSA
jgi:kynurenine formamidase